MNKYTMLPYLKTALLALGLLTMFGGLTAQTAPPPPPDEVLLIPYNDRGTWGYCDTLGNLVIDPAYQEATFFFRNSVGGEIFQAAKVVTKWGENRILTSGELLLPKKMSYKKVFYANGKSTHSFLVSKKGKYGVYDLNEGIILPTKYDTLIEDWSWILLKRKGDETYRRYNPTTRELEAQEYLGLKSYTRRYNSVMIATTPDGRNYEMRDNELCLIPAEEMSTLRQDDDFVDVELVEDVASRVPYRWTGTKPTAAVLGVDRILTLKDYSSLNFGDTYGFERIIIAEKDGQAGVLSGQGEIILPFQYDRLTLTSSDTQIILEKDGKVGRKLLFTIHPTIEPRYDKLNERISLRVNPRWVFAVYEAELNGNKGYVGENGVEYFRWE